jgi:DNA-binding CsgD family transcriptional regulator/pimeloyl-ACP methyl ester carboxylesterase
MTKQDRDQDQLVNTIYDVVLDPTRYHELVTQWQNQLKASNLKDDTQEVLMAHLSRATEMLSRFEMHHHDVEIENVLNSETQPTLIVNSDGTVITANKTAVDIYGVQPGDQIDILKITPEASKQIEKAIKIVCQRQGNQSQCKIIRAARLQKPVSTILISITPMSVPDGLTVGVIKTTEILWPEHLDPLLTDVFQLTNAEIGVVRLLVAGNTLREISERRRTSLKTVRTQLKIIFQKTQTQTQQELLRLIIGFSQLGVPTVHRPHSQPRQSNGSNHHLLGATTQFLHARGLPRMEFIQHGEATGIPVMTFHDEILGDAFLNPILQLTQSKAFRFHVPVRFGYGQSEEATSQALRCKQISQAIATYVAQQKFETPIRILTHGNGLYFALRLACLFPDLCRSITAISPALPIQNKSDLEGMPKYNRFISSSGLFAPKMLEFGLRSGFALYQRIGPSRFINMIYNAPEDARMIKSKNVMSVLEYGGRLVRGGGYTALLSDERDIARDWSHLASACNCSITLVLGTGDSSSRWHRAKKFQTLNPMVMIETIDDSAVLTSFTNPQTVLSTLRR